MAPVLPTVYTPPQNITRRTLTIRTTPSDVNLTKCHPQDQSILYQIPKELRDLIFEFTLAQYEDKNRPYAETEYYYRPGHTARLRTSTNLLLACKRIWLEANALAMRQVEHTFWYQRGPHDKLPDSGWNMNITEENRRYAHFTSILTSNNMCNLTTVHLFMQMFKLERLQRERMFSTLFTASMIHQGVKPKLFWIIVRHTDWWNWEEDAPLRADEGWLQHLVDFLPGVGVREFRLELETLERKKDQLQAIVDRFMRCEGIAILHPPTADGEDKATKMVTKKPPEFWHWYGSIHVGDKDHEIYAGQTKLHYRVAVLAWHTVPSLIRRDGPEREVSFARSSPYLPNLASQRALQRDHGRLSRMRDMRWRRLSFLDKVQHVSGLSNMQADAVEIGRRESFERCIGDWHAARIEKEWAANGSLLKFEPL